MLADFLMSMVLSIYLGLNLIPIGLEHKLGSFWTQWPFTVESDVMEETTEMILSKR
jgi:hypothetical protein